jgi:hypothetical protein
MGSLNRAWQRLGRLSPLPFVVSVPVLLIAGVALRDQRPIGDAMAFLGVATLALYVVARPPGRRAVVLQFALLPYLVGAFPLELLGAPIWLGVAAIPLAGFLVSRDEQAFALGGGRAEGRPPL